MNSRLLLLGLATVLLGSGCDPSGSQPLPAAFPLAWTYKGAFEDRSNKHGVIADGKMYILSDRSLESINLENGKGVWSQPIPYGSYTIEHDAGRIFSFRDAVRAFDAATGSPLWVNPIGGDTLGYANFGLAYGGRVFTGTDRSGRVFALDGASGRLLWTAELADPSWRFFNSVISVDVHEGVLYAQLSRSHVVNGFFRSTHVVALDPATGRELWRYVDGDGTRPYQAAGRLAFFGDLILHSDATDGWVAAFDRRTRQQVWKYNLPEGWLGTLMGPLVENGVAYVATGEGVAYALNAATGALQWKTEPGHTWHTRAICGRWLGTASTGAQSFDKATGAPGPNIHWRQPTLVTSAVMSDGKKFYLAAQDGVYAYTCTP